MDTTSEPSVEGESAFIIRDIFLHMEWTPGPDGLMHVEYEMPAHEYEPFGRAFERVVAELEELDASGLDGADQSRTPEQRGADAVVILAQRTANAISSLRR